MFGAAAVALTPNTVISMTTYEATATVPFLGIRFMQAPSTYWEASVISPPVDNSAK